MPDTQTVEVSIPFGRARDLAGIPYRLVTILPRGQVQILAFHVPADWDADLVVGDLRLLLGTDDVHLVIEAEEESPNLG